MKKIGDVIRTTDGFYQIDDTKCVLAISEVRIGDICCISTMDGTFKVHRLKRTEVLKYYLGKLFG